MKVLNITEFEYTAMIDNTLIRRIYHSVNAKVDETDATAFLAVLKNPEPG